MKTIEKDLKGNEFIIKMIGENKIEYMVPFKLDGTMIRYDLKSLELIGDLSGKTNKDILEIIRKLLMAYSNFENHLLDNFIVLERGKIYMDDFANPRFIVETGRNTSKEDLRKLIKDLIISREIPFDDDLKTTIEILNEIFKNPIDNEKIIDIINKVSYKTIPEKKDPILKRLGKFFKKGDNKDQNKDVKIRFELPEK